MTAHAFARQLLAGPDLEIVVPKVLTYSFDAANCFQDPVVKEEEAELRDGKPAKVLLISYCIRNSNYRLPLPRTRHKRSRPPAHQGDHNHSGHNQFGAGDQ